MRVGNEEVRKWEFIVFRSEFKIRQCLSMLTATDRHYSQHGSDRFHAHCSLPSSAQRPLPLAPFLSPDPMARTGVTAKKATGGNAPRRELGGRVPGALPRAQARAASVTSCLSSTLVN